MNLSIVLWNCNGPKGSTQENRIKSMTNTYERWRSEGKIPSIVLAQEVKGKGKTFWRERAERNPNNNTETACFPFLSARRVKFIPLNTDGIKYCILTIGRDKLLICSCHGPHTGFKCPDKKVNLKRMLTMVDRIKRKNKCCAALVGGDYNLVSRVCTEVLSDRRTQPPTGAKVYDDYITPPWREHLIDFIIAWPKERFLQQKCSPIPIVDPNNTDSKITDGTLFDHAPIRYDFIFTLPGQKLQPMIGQGVEEHLSASLQISLKLADDNLDYNTEIKGFPAWVIPKNNLESTIITKERSDKADKIISILLCYEHFRRELTFPENDDTAEPSLKWGAVIPSCLLRGINIYHSEDCGENLSIETAIEIANKYNKNENIKIIETETREETLPKCLADVAEYDNTAVMLNTNGKTISFVRNGDDNESVILIDSHFQKDNGALIKKISKENFEDTSKFLPKDMRQPEYELTTIEYPGKVEKVESLKTQKKTL